MINSYRDNPDNDDDDDDDDDDECKPSHSGVILVARSLPLSL